MDLSIEKTIDVYNAEEGDIVLPAKLFTEIIRKLPDEEINISLEEYNNVSIRTSGSEFKIVGMEADEFPEMENVSEDANERISFDIETFREMIKKTSFAASTDESKGVIVGVLIEMRSDSINMVALDGFRMAVSSETVHNGKDTDIIISARILNEISKIISESENTDDGENNIELIFDDKKAVISNSDSKIILRIIEGKFLKYRDLLPDKFKTIVNINKNMLHDSIERASLFAKEGRNNLIKLSITDDNLQITSKSEAGNVNENIPINKEGDDIEIGFNSKYLLDGLKAIKEDNIVMNFNTNVTPCIFRPLEGDNYTYLILPVRIII